MFAHFISALADITLGGDKICLNAQTQKRKLRYFEMYYETNIDLESNLLLMSRVSDGNQDTECALSQFSAGYDLSSMSSDQQNQVAVVQALMDLNASTQVPCSRVDTYSQQSCALETPQKFEKRSCNCTKSHCLKLYCECFARGQSCDGCNCSNCMNNFNFEDDRKKAIKSTLERNPLAFYPKIGIFCIIYGLLKRVFCTQTLQRL